MTNPFKKLKRLCTQPFIIIAVHRKQFGLFGQFCVDEMWLNVQFFYRQQLIEVSHLQQHLVNYGKFSEVP